MHSSTDLRLRVRDRITAWRVAVEHIAETDSSVLAFGRRDDQAVVVKIIKSPGDEWMSGAILQAFDGKGVIRVFDYVEGALLLERLDPGSSLVGIALGGDDRRATEILADVIGKMSPGHPADGVPTVDDWRLGFERYHPSDDGPISKGLVEDAHQLYAELFTSQSRRRLLHGDLHHGNVLLDSQRGWLAIDPKGVVGEPEYELGAALRNPLEKPELFLRLSTIRARTQQFAERLQLDAERILAWTFAQAVLSCIWLVEDGFTVRGDNPWLVLAKAVRPMIRGR